jgi:amino acid transporter
MAGTEGNPLLAVHRRLIKQNKFDQKLAWTIWLIFNLLVVISFYFGVRYHQVSFLIGGFAIFFLWFFNHFTNRLLGNIPGRLGNIYELEKKLGYGQAEQSKDSEISHLRRLLVLRRVWAIVITVVWGLVILFSNFKDFGSIFRNI